MTLMLPDDVIAPTYTMSNDLKGITEPAPPTLYPQAPDAFWANVNPQKFSVSSRECLKKGGSYDQSTNQLNMMFLSSQTGGSYYAKKGECVI